MLTTTHHQTRINICPYQAVIFHAQSQQLIAVKLHYGALTLHRLGQRMPTHEEYLSERWHTSRTLATR